MRLTALPTSSGVHALDDGRCVLTLTHDGTLVASGHGDASGSVAFVRAASDAAPALVEQAAAGLDALPHTATAVAAAHASGLIAVAADDTKCVTVFAVPGFKPLGVVSRMGLPVRALAFSPDDARM